MAPAVGKPWLVTFRSTRNSANPTSTRTTPMAGGIAIIGKVPSVRPVGMLVTVATSFQDDCTAHHYDDLRALGVADWHPSWSGGVPPYTRSLSPHLREGVAAERRDGTDGRNKFLGTLLDWIFQLLRVPDMVEAEVVKWEAPK